MLLATMDVPESEYVFQESTNNALETYISPPEVAHYYSKEEHSDTKMAFFIQTRSQEN